MEIRNLFQIVSIAALAKTNLLIAAIVSVSVVECFSINHGIQRLNHSIITMEKKREMRRCIRTCFVKRV
jgi:hypothetical protein